MTQHQDDITEIKVERRELLHLLYESMKQEVERQQQEDFQKIFDEGNTDIIYKIRQYQTTDWLMSYQWDILEIPDVPKRDQFSLEYQWYYFYYNRIKHCDIYQIEILRNCLEKERENCFNSVRNTKKEIVLQRFESWLKKIEKWIDQLARKIRPMLYDMYQTGIQYFKQFPKLRTGSEGVILASLKNILVQENPVYLLNFVLADQNIMKNTQVKEMVLPYRDAIFQVAI